MKRTGKGTFAKGQSGNPGGRPKSQGLAADIRQRTKEGADLVSFALDVLNDEHEETRDRLAALRWLADRGWGKVPQPLEHSGPDGEPFTFVIHGPGDSDS